LILGLPLLGLPFLGLPFLGLPLLGLPPAVSGSATGRLGDRFCAIW